MATPAPVSLRDVAKNAGFADPASCRRRATLCRVKALLLSLTLIFGTEAVAVTRLVVDAAELDLPGKFSAHRVQATVSFSTRDQPALHVRAAHIELGNGANQLKAVDLACGVFEQRGTELRCRNGRISAELSSAQSIARMPGLKTVNGAISADYDAHAQRLTINADQLQFVGGSWRLYGQWQPERWQLNAASANTAVANWINWLQPFWQAPADLQFDGRVAVSVTAEGAKSRLDAATLHTEFSAFNLQNAAGTVATEKLIAVVQAELRGELAAPSGTVRIRASSGQALLGPVFLDFAAQPMRLDADLRVQSDAIVVPEFQLALQDLLQARGAAQWARAPQMQLERADIQLAGLRFPAAFASFLQLPLATTNFGALETRGSLSGGMAVRAGALASIDLTLDGLDIIDSAREWQLAGLHGPVHWSAAGAPAPAVSNIGWERLRVSSLEGGASDVQLTAHGTSLSLTQPARIAIFDGALAVQRFEALHMGSDAMSLNFDATIEPIGMQQLSVAFGWPAMAGTLSGRVPALAYRDNILSVAGDVVASVFDGQVTVRKLQLRNALSRFPRLTAEVSARRLDLEQITRTFPVGSITGRLDANVRTLELFDWSPIAFDAELYSTVGDQTRHRISQKAVDSISRLGGGRGLGSALQSGLLRFFDDFGYERIGLRCQLRNDVCLMSGIDKGGGTYYMVKGGGVPRIDVVGNAGRVAWKQLVSQISAALQSNELVVK